MSVIDARERFPHTEEPPAEGLHPAVRSVYQWFLALIAAFLFILLMATIYSVIERDPWWHTPDPCASADTDYACYEPERSDYP